MKSILFLLFLAVTLNAQDNIGPESENFYFDAIVFDNQESDSSRVDSFFMIPYQSLSFQGTGDIFGASFQIVISVYDTSSMKVLSRSIERTVSAENYFESLGGTGEFTKASLSFNLSPGEYTLKAELIDKFNNQAYEKKRNISVINFNDFDFALGGMMLVSAIEEINGKFKITPFLSDNIGKIKEGFFVFFEAYNYKNVHDSVVFRYEVSSDGEVIGVSKPIVKDLNKDVNRVYLRIEIPQKLLPGALKLRVNAYKHVEGDSLQESNILAAAQRSIKIEKTLGSSLISDIDEAAKQLFYVATNDEYNYVNDAETQEEKVKRFEEFWKAKDPSPGTTRNEAQLEYYSRISFANKNFRSYSKGWRTDKGMIYVIFGPPYNVLRGNDYGDGRGVYEKWVYLNNREFLFMDNTGFGDYRLVRPISVTEKYEYGR